MKHDKERFLSSCRAGADYVVADGAELTVYTAAERPLYEAGALVFVNWAKAHDVDCLVVKSNLLKVRLGQRAGMDQVLGQLEACRNLPLTEGMAEIVDRSGLWDDLPAEAAAFIRVHGSRCDVFSHLREPIGNVPRSQFRWIE